mgnify:CR=1 FL=1
MVCHRTEGRAINAHHAGRMEPAIAIEDMAARKSREAIPHEVQSFVEAFVETMREPILILDRDLRVRMANESFLRTFRAARADTEGHPLFDLGNGQWEIPELRQLLKDLIGSSAVFRDFEVAHDFPAIGRRTMVLNARLLNQPGVFGDLFLLAMEDTTPALQSAQAGGRAAALQSAIFNSANFSSIATDAKGVIQIFNVGAERMLGYTAAEVMNKITPAEISDPQEVIARAKALSIELGTPITPGFEALVFKASRGIEDIYELTYFRKDGSRFPAVVSVTALRDAQDAIIGYLLIGTDNTARKQAEEALLRAGALQSAIFNSANFSSIATDAEGVIQIFNVGAERMLGYTAAEVMNKITPADISDPQEVIARAKALSVELGTPITPGFDALVFKASRGIEDIYELTYIRKDGSRFPAVVSVTALRDAQDAIIGYLLIGTDNTARKQAEEALLKAGALQSAIFNSANFSSIATDAKGVIQIFNVGAERMLGYTAAEVMNRITPAEISDPQEVIARAKALSIELGTPITPGFEALVFKASRGIEDIYELTYFRKDGSRFPAVVSVTALRDAQDAIIGYLLIGTDNTARKQAEEALVKAGALQSAIFNSANFSSIATDAKGVIQIFNVGAERMLGYTAADVMNKITPADISDPKEVIARAKALSVELKTPITPGFEALVFKASRGIEDIYELTYIRKDGSRFPAVVSVTALRDDEGAIIGYLLIGTDNTARKQVEEERMKLDQRLRDQQFYTRSLIESNIDAIMTTDPQGIITDANKQMEALTGCTRDELIGAPFKNYFTDPERADAAIKLVLSEKKVTNYELTARTRDGKQTVVSYNATTFYDRDRRLQGVFAAARDVTERKRLDHALEEAKESAEDANRAKSDFLARMSHEIRTPMNAIIGMADLLWETPLASEQREYVRIFKKAGTQLLDLINDILDLSKVESGHLTLESLDFDLAEVLDKTLEMMAIRAHEKGLELALRIAPDVFTALVGDGGRLRQVLINLIGNAIKFTEKGEVTVRVEVDPANRVPGGLRFAVSDTGIGIPEESREVIFAPYSQVDTSTTRKFGGTGLGLTISRRVVELMQGRIWAESTVGEGSTFYFTAQLVPGTRPTQRNLTRPMDLDGLKTLIIDDNGTNRLILNEMLARWGAQVTEADGGEQGVLALLQARHDGVPFGLVLLDRRMPGVDGFQVAEQIFHEPALARTTILMLTSENRAGDIARGRELGVAAYLVKPVKKAELIEAIQEARRGAARAAEPETPSEAVVVTPRSLRILLAEDSQDNVLLIQSYLKASGYTAEVAGNGEVALQKFISGAYDIVLMDVQMPVMDGYSATRGIRRWEADNQVKPVPILALTAHALPEEVRKSLDAGCTAHLTKPIRKATLLGAILEHTTVVVRVDSSLASLVPGFLENRRKDVSAIAASLELSDYDNVRFLGHNMKGSGTGYGLSRITEIGAALEQAAGLRSSEEIRARAADLVRYLDRLRVEHE